MNFYPSKNVIDLMLGATNGISQLCSILTVGEARYIFLNLEIQNTIHFHGT